jgi:hypothetical protein
VPMHLSKNSTHSIYFPELDLRLPLEMDGVVSFLPTRIPLEREMVECRHLHMTSDDVWDPTLTDFATQEKTVLTC